MREAVKSHGSPAPVFESTGFFTAIFRPLAGDAAEVTAEVTAEVQIQRLLSVLKGEISRQALQDALGLTHAEHFRKIYLLPALAAGVVEMTIPHKPRSPKQRYRITACGIDVLKQTKKDR